MSAPGEGGLSHGSRVPLGAALLLLAALGLAAPVRGAEADEYQVKGAFLLNFASFVEWPSQSQVGANEETRICVLGNQQVTSILSQVLEGKSARSREVVVRRIDNLAGVAWCRILFVTKSAEMDPEAAINSLGAASILTVGETDGFAANGGMVNFTVHENKVRFEINQRAAHRAGLKISSKLLRLARLVED